MSPSDLIARHIATKGVTVCPPAIAAYGWSPGISVSSNASIVRREAFNTMDANPKKGANPARDEANAQRAREYAARAKAISDEYGLAPSPETLQVLSRKYGLGIPMLARMCRECGHQDVRTSADSPLTSQVEVSKRIQALLVVLTEYADTGIECPSNPTIAARTGFGDATVSDYMRKLIKSGHITVETLGMKRCITIRATGRATARPASMEKKP